MVSDSTRRIQSEKDDKESTRRLFGQDEVGLAINAYLMADKSAREGNERASAERQQHLAGIQARYWRLFFALLSANLARRRQSLEFSDEERLFMDLGLIDARMLGGDREQATRELLEEINSKGVSGCHYLSEWLVHRHQQLQLEFSLSGGDEPAASYASQLDESRHRILSRLSEFFAGLPGIPLEVAESMRSGELDNALITSGIVALREPRRKNLLRRRNLWLLREQILAKAQARASNQAIFKLFELLNEIYARDWRERYENFLNEYLPEKAKTSAIPVQEGATISVANANVDLLMSEARQIRMRMVLMGAVDGKERPDIILAGSGPRLTKAALAEFLTVAQTFDRTLAELPPIVLVPGSGRGFFSWENGCVMLAVRPMVGVDDSAATAFARLRMLDDRLNKGGELRRAYEKKFPGAVFQNDFPADYRAWLCRLSKGESGAMSQDRRTFFRENVGPDLSGPILPPNLRNIGPQTMVAICRRLEKQLASGDNDVNLHRRLAALYWQQGNMEAAGLQFTAAMQKAPNDGETLFAAGMFLRGRGDNEAANDCFRYGVQRDSGSLWGIYCQDALANLL